MIIEAVILCVEQGLALRGHRDHGKPASDDDDGNMKKVYQGNFLAIVNTFAKFDTILKDHIEQGSRNAKMLSCHIQNDIISCLAEFVRDRTKEHISKSTDYAIIADEVTERYSNKEVLLICLQYLRYIKGDPRTYETFFDSMHIKGRPTGQTIGKTILEILENNGINVADSRAQAYDGAKVMSIKISGAATFTKKQQPLAEYTHCRSHVINLAISFACKNKSIQKFMDDLTTVCYFFDNLPKRQQFFELLINSYGEKLNLNETKRRDIIGLSKTRWVERYRAYENYYLLHCCI